MRARPRPRKAPFAHTIVHESCRRDSASGPQLHFSRAGHILAQVRECKRCLGTFRAQSSCCYPAILVTTETCSVCAPGWATALNRMSCVHFIAFIFGLHCILSLRIAAHEHASCRKRYAGRCDLVQQLYGVLMWWQHHTRRLVCLYSRERVHVLSRCQAVAPTSDTHRARAIINHLAEFCARCPLHCLALPCIASECYICRHTFSHMSHACTYVSSAYC